MQYLHTTIVDKIWGREILYKSDFPLYIKVIEANLPLSIQVHPNDNMAHRLGLPFGKDEMWYVLEARPDAHLKAGLNHIITPGQLDSYLDTNTIEMLLRRFSVQKGDYFNIPAGRIHALGEGIRVLEIQTPCDETYRLFDYNRIDSKGNNRPLNIELAREAINYFDNNESDIKNPLEPLFLTNILSINNETGYYYNYQKSSFLLFCLKGSSLIFEESGDKAVITKDNAIIVPSNISLVKFLAKEYTEIMVISSFVNKK